MIFDEINLINFPGHDENEDEHDSSNVSSEEQSFEIDDTHEMDNIHDIRHMITPTPKVIVDSSSRTSNESNDSIFVVMTDRKRLGTIDLNVAFSNTTNKQDNLHKRPQTAIDDVSNDDSDEFFDNLPKRDEDDITNDVSHVLLGGILIAAPPRSSEVHKSVNGIKSGTKIIQSHNNNYDVNRHEEINEHLNNHQGAAVIEETRTISEKNRNGEQFECQPECKTIDNELCQQIEDSTRCVCRPGFARMFPDRPCKRNCFFSI